MVSKLAIKSKVQRSVLALLTVGLLSSCANDNLTEPKIAKIGKIPIFAPKSINIPFQMCQSGKAGAHLTISYIKFADIIEDLGKFFIPDSECESLDWQITWFVSGMTVSLVAFEEDSDYRWTVTLNGKSETIGINYDNFLLMEMEQDRSNTSGKCRIHDLWRNSADLLNEFSWSSQAGGSVRLKTVFYGSNRPVEKVTIISNTDYSGSLYYHEFQDTGMEELKFRSKWSFEGAGECWVYDRLGNVILYEKW